jgi:hypothetical protein
MTRAWRERCIKAGSWPMLPIVAGGFLVVVMAVIVYNLIVDWRDE